MKRLILPILFSLLLIPVVSAQTTDVDKLLKDGFEDLRNKKYEDALEKANRGLQLAPDYTDFYLLAGRVSQLTGRYDSARFYLRNVVGRSPEYEDAWSYLIEVEQQDNRLEKAMELTERAIETHPQTKEFRIKKMEIYQLMLDERTEYEYVKTLRPTYPDDPKIKERFNYLQSKYDNDRVGVNYSYTTFDRDNYGPWHLGAVQYIHERNWGSVIGRVSYANRFSDGRSVADGLQYEAESFLFQGRSSYHYIGIAYSDDLVFPHWRGGYSLFSNYRKGWESDFGFRYTRAGGRSFYTGVIGGGKYIGSYWINLRAFLQFEDSDFYPAFALTTRYYFNTRFDYIQGTAGYGTSPDDRPALGQFDQRVGLQSYRVGAGYFRLFGDHWVTGINLNFNRQEYFPGLRQNEYEFSLMLQYKF